jgi:transposase
VKLTIARLRAREIDRRKDWAEKASTDIARRFDVILVENLRIGNMTRSAGHAVTARGGFRNAGPVNREPQLLLQSA